MNITCLVLIKNQNFSFITQISEIDIKIWLHQRTTTDKLLRVKLQDSETTDYFLYLLAYVKGNVEGKTSVSNKENTNLRYSAKHRSINLLQKLGKFSFVDPREF